MSTGIEARHARTCGSRTGDRCTCRPTYQASTYDVAAQKKVRKTFKTISAAKRWRQDAAVAVRTGELTANRGPTLKAATDQWLADMDAGHERTRSGDPYKPSAIRGYRQSLTKRVLPTLGRHRIKEITARDVQALMDQLVRDGNAPATIDGALTPLRAFYRRALVRGEVNRNPTVGVIKPAVRSEPKAIAPPSEVVARLAALHGEDRTLWALAFYSGLRRGEIIGLRPEDVNLAAGVIHVRRGWDMEHGEIKPKSQRGHRNVPVPAPLRDHLDQHLLDHGDRERVFRSPRWVAKGTDRARQAWADAGLQPITLHVARHSYASLMIAAGVNAKALSAFMGHASIQTTFNLYGHLMPGSEAEAADLLDAFLARDAAALTGAQTGAQKAQALS